MRHPYPDVVLGNMVRELRLDCGLEVPDVAKRMAWPANRLRALEDGVGGVSFSDFVPLARLFGLDLEAFACDFLTNLEESHVDFRQLELELADTREADDLDDYYLHD
jgi:transcriptional regulator with XRE-family HTH domain